MFIKNYQFFLALTSFYKNLLFKKKKNGIRVLMYHSIIDDDDIYTDLFQVKKSNFYSQMKFLKENNYNIVDSKLSNFIENKINILITFDDGNISLVKNAFPILNNFSFTYLIFIIASNLMNNTKNFIKKDSMKDNTNLCTYGSHGYFHEDFRKKETSKLQEELTKSKNIIEEYSCKKVEDISFPFGLYNSKTLIACKQAGFKKGFNSKIYINKKNFFLNNFEIYRTPIWCVDTIDTFIDKINGFYDWYFLKNYIR